MTKRDFLRIFIKLGIACIPLHHRSKEPSASTWREYQERLPTHTEYLSWFRTDWCNYGVIAGWNNLVVLDFDSLLHFSLWREFMFASNMARVFETAFKVVTNHGLHVYLRTSERTENSKRIALSGGIDVQAQGKYVVGPGCVHPSGTQYVPVGELQLVQVDCIETVLPVDLFPYASTEPSAYNGSPIALPTIPSNNIDPLAFSALDLISKVKASVRIESLYAGVQRSSVDGRWLKALCPFHTDSHQSAWIDTHRQIAGCQVCGMKPMDCINFVARARGISDRDAVIALAAECGVWR